MPLDAHWNLVHATHGTADELKAVSASGASIVICPSTEANLGDGIFDFSGYAGGTWAIGSDSHVTRNWTQELRLLEYSQRLTQRRRNVAAHAARTESSATALFQAALMGANSATSQPLGAIKVGHRADFLVLDDQSPALLGVPLDYLLDALVFSSPDARFAAVFVGGRRVFSAAGLAGGKPDHDLWPQLTQGFVRTMQSLWS